MELKRNDIKVLEAALKSNGGGIDPDLFPSIAIMRCHKAGLIQRKPNHYSHHTGYTWLVTITPAGKEALRAAQQSKGEKT